MNRIKVEEAVSPSKCLCIHALDGYETYKIDDNTIGVRPIWISVNDKEVPKTGKFLFSYHCGIGLVSWGQAYTTVNGNSERTHEIYFLILWPQDISENNGEPMQWNDEKMKEMDVYWMPLPEMPNETI